MIKAKALIIEDEAELAELIALYLRREGIECGIAGSAEEGLASLAKESYDILLLDLNLPGMDGFEFLRRFRAESSLPVIIVSSREADEDLVLGLGLGADEFVTKPFSGRVLAARVEALLRRARKIASPRAIEIGPFAIDVDACIVKKDGKRVALSAKEFDVLAFLARSRGKAFPPEKVYKEVWGDIFGDQTAVAVYIQRLRRKIEDDPSKPRYLVTVPGKGYRFDDAERQA